MSDKPEKIWVRRCPADCGADYCDIIENEKMADNSTEYIRADLAKPSEWISVDDRLPPEHQEVFVWPMEIKVVWLNEFESCDVVYRSGFYEPSGKDPIEPQTHWQPLPAPLAI